MRRAPASSGYPPAMEHLWQRAASFAARVHAHQLRDDEQTPYFAHTARVAMVIALVFGERDEDLMAAALLHDAIEDTPTDYDEIAEAFGPVVADAVAAMSKDMRIEESKREKAYDRQLAKGPWRARMIKLADVYDNMIDQATGGLTDKMLSKVRRAVDLAKGDARLAKARRLVEAKAREMQDGVSSV